MTKHSFLNECRNCVPLVVGAAGTLMLLLLAAYSLKYWGNTSFEVLFRDMASAEEIPVYQGLFSQIGVILWSVAIGILLVVTLGTSKVNSRPVSNFLRFSLLLTLVLALDDAFLLHESVFRDLFGVDEKVTFGIYGLLILTYLYRFGEIILQSKVPLLLLGLGFFGFSMFVDLLPRLAVIIGIDHLFLIEDGSKLAGILFWTIYQFTNARRYLPYAPVREGITV